MHVKSVFVGFFTTRLVVGSIVMVAILFIASSFTGRSDRELRAKQVNLIVRQIGHQLLLQAGDSTSRVLPVTQIGEGTFMLRFEDEFVFNHDSLMMLSQSLLSKAQFPSGYTVTVHECMKTDIVFGFQANNTSPDVLACKGRKQPSGCYTIEIAFPDYHAETFDNPILNVVSGSMVVLLGLTLLIGRFGKGLAPMPMRIEDPAAIEDTVPELATLGNFQFDVKSQRLLWGSEVINLTDKESRILELLSNDFGELISRETLMQKIWINEGVITGRSLDVFVSRLRKKLVSDPQLRITNVHGKGYKLEIPGVL
jgi:hypothetical protein